MKSLGFVFSMLRSDHMGKFRSEISWFSLAKNVDFVRKTVEFARKEGQTAHQNTPGTKPRRSEALQFSSKSGLQKSFVENRRLTK